MENNSDPAFSRLFDEYYARVHRIILRLVRDPSEAEELAQETFIKAYRHLPDLKDPEKCASWLYRIATNTALDHVRKRSFKQSRSQADLDTGAPVALAEGRIEDKAERDETDRCVRAYAEGLPDLYRAVLVLHELEGLPLSEVAKATSSSISATKVRLHRARIKFAALCSAECEQFYNEDNVLCCEPSGNTSCHS